MTRTIARTLAVCLLTGVAAAQSGGVLDGLTVRILGGLDHLGGVEDLNKSIAGMNYYFGPNGTWLVDAQGTDLGQGGWSPVLKMDDLTNRPDFGLALEKNILKGEHTRLLVGLEYTTGATSTSSEFSYVPPNSSLSGSLFAKERIAVSNMLLTARYSLKDLNLPLHAHVGAGVGYGKVESDASFIAGTTSITTYDPEYGSWQPYQMIDAKYDGNALTARLFLGMEWMTGPVSLQFDVGYNYMDFGTLDGETVAQSRKGQAGMREELSGALGAYGLEIVDLEDLTDVRGSLADLGYDPDEVLQNVEYYTVDAIDPATVPDGRYELAPLISGHLENYRRSVEAELLGIPGPGPIDAGNPGAIAYNLSGGYVRFSVGYTF